MIVWDFCYRKKFVSWAWHLGDGYREVLGAAEGMKEAKNSWVSFFQGLWGRGLDGVKLVSKMLKAPVGQRQVHEYEVLRDRSEGCLYCWLILFCQSLHSFLRIFLDITNSPSTNKNTAVKLLRHNEFTIFKYKKLTDYPSGVICQLIMG